MPQTPCSWDCPQANSQENDKQTLLLTVYAVAGSYLYLRVSGIHKGAELWGNREKQTSERLPGQSKQAS